MDADALLSELEPLPHGERRRRLAALRGRLGGSELAGLLDDLGGRGHYERSLALTIAAAARDEAALAHIRSAVRDDDAALACRAIALMTRTFDRADEALFGRLVEEAPAAVRARTYQAIRRARRGDLAELLIDRATERWGAAEGAALLPACGERVAAERLDGLAHAVPNWKSFGSAHPGLMLDHAERRLPDVPSGMRAEWWQRHAPGLAAAVPYAPDRVVGLLERHWTAGPMPAALLPYAGRLLDAEPARMLAVLLAPRHRPYLSGYLGPLRRRSVRSRLIRLGDDDFAAVVRAVRDDEEAVTLLLKSLPPSRRDAVFTAAMSGLDLTTWEPGARLLEVLPAARRAHEAARMLRIRRIAGSPARYRQATSFLPYDQAAPVLQAVTRRTDADDRAAGYRLLIACAGRSRDASVLTGLLETVARLRNEQDPVRFAAVQAFATMPPGLIEPVHVPAFAQLVDDALDARDCSYQTRYALVRLATRVFEQGAIRDDADLMVFALDVFTRLTGHMGSIYLGPLDRLLRRGREHDLVARLAGRLEAEAARDEHRLAFTLARSLGRRGYGVPVLQDALEKALDARSDSDIEQAVAHWLAPPYTRAERVAVVVAKDPSTVNLAPVFAAIAAHRTDLLHLVFDHHRSAGRFRRPGVAYVPAAERAWMLRWTAEQRSVYLTMLHRLARDPRVPEAERGRAVGIIARVPGAGAAQLRRYLDSPDAYVRRTALTASVHTASPQAVLPDLLALAASDDAHVAVYAATRAARFTPPSALGDALAPVLANGKVTARKEALRLLAEHRVPGAADRLAAVWDDRRQHHDVKAAVVSAARRFLAEPAALRILGEAASGPASLARQVLGVRPLDIEPRWRTAYAELVVRVVGSADAEARNAALPLIPLWAPWASDATGALAEAAGDLATTESWRLAVDALVACALGGDGIDDVRSLVARLAAAPGTPEAEPDRDLPATQRLRALVDAVRSAAQADRESAGPVIEAACAELPDPLAAELIAATVRWEGPETVVAAVLEDLVDRPLGGVLAIDRVARALAGPADQPEPELVLPHARRLGSGGDLAGGLMAVALAGEHGPRAGWPPEWRELLKRLRRHQHTDVAYAAGDVHTAVE